MMRIPRVPLLAAGISVLFMAHALAAVGDRDELDTQTGPDYTGSVAPLTDNVARLDMRLEEEGGPDSGHVRVMLTPISRPLTLREARTAAEKAFFETLNDPGIGDALTRVRVVVKLSPRSDRPDAQRVYLFQLGDENAWRIELADPFASGEAE